MAFDDEARKARDCDEAGGTGATGAAASGLRPGRSPRQPRLFTRIFVALAAVSTIATVVVLVVSTIIYQSTVLGDAGKMLEGDCRMIKSSLRSDDNDGMRLVSLDTGEVRVTLVGADGSVLYDSQNGVDSMPNHADRPEVAEALSEGAGSSERPSETDKGKVSIYRAMRLDNGNVLRVSVDRQDAASALAHDTGLVLAVVAVVVACCWVVARVLAGLLVRPVRAIDPANPDPTSSYQELTPMLEQIADQQDTLAEQVEQLRGSDLMRREFTSNVTHELKTPLASISGAAELIRDGIARPRDVRQFAGRIYDEAHRMTELVNDILILSKLDESERSQDRELMGTTNPVDLSRVASDVCDRLSGQAKSADVTLSADGSEVVIEGLPRLLDELVYNLCDNAIRYNHEGGHVGVWTGIVEGHPVVRVSDDGVGIPYDQQRKVFERFYRVESSRSKEKGGTGLGLAIVKHAAAYHGATIGMDSEPGRGTTVRVTFPAEALVDLGGLA